MPIFTVPLHERDLREFNDCHTPAGSPEGGQFCSKGLPSGVFAVRAGEVSFKQLLGQQRRFLFNPRLGVMVFGADALSPNERPEALGHAVEFNQLQVKDPDAAPGKFDDYVVRGHLDGVTPAGKRVGVLNFDSWRREAVTPDDMDSYLKAVEFFVRMGATGETYIRQFPFKEVEDGPLKTMFPALAPTRRRNRLDRIHPEERPEVVSPWVHRKPRAQRYEINSTDTGLVVRDRKTRKTLMTTDDPDEAEAFIARLQPKRKRRLK